MKQTLKKISFWMSGLLAAMAITLGSAWIVYPVVSELVGLGVNASSTQWNPIKDAGVQSDGVSSGMASAGIFGFNGTTWDRLRSTVANGLQVDVTRLPTTGLGVMPIQGTTLLNSTNTSGAAAAQTITLVGVANTRIHLYGINTLSCSPAGTSNVTVDDSTITLYGGAANQVPAAPMFLDLTWPQGLTAPTGASMHIIIASCGAGNVSFARVVADQF